MIWDRFPIEGHTVTLDKCYLPRKLMTRECALQIIVSEEKWGKGTMRPELLGEARKVLNGPVEA